MQRFFIHHLFIRETDTVASAMLSNVHRRVGPVDQIFTRDSVKRVNGQAKARSDRNSNRPVRIHLPHVGLYRDRVAQALGKLKGFMLLDIGEQDCELFAAIASNVVLQAYASAQLLPDKMQDFIARAMPPGIVDAFEAIDIHKNNGAVPLRGLALLDLPIDTIHNVAMVGQASQGIGGREGAKMGIGDAEIFVLLLNTSVEILQFLARHFVDIAHVIDGRHYLLHGLRYLPNFVLAPIENWKASLLDRYRPVALCERYQAIRQFH